MRNKTEITKKNLEEFCEGNYFSDDVVITTYNEEDDK